MEPNPWRDNWTNQRKAQELLFKYARLGRVSTQSTLSIEFPHHYTYTQCLTYISTMFPTWGVLGVFESETDLNEIE